MFQGSSKQSWLLVYAMGPLIARRLGHPYDDDPNLYIYLRAPTHRLAPDKALKLTQDLRACYPRGPDPVRTTIDFLRDLSLRLQAELALEALGGGKS